MSDGFLKVTMPSLAADIRPTVDVIDGSSLTLVASSREQLISIAPGRYLVTATMPTGQRAMDVVEIVAGKTEEVELGRAQFEVDVRGDTQPDLGPGVLAPLESPGAAGSAAASAEPAAWMVRFVSFACAKSSRPVEPQVEVRTTKGPAQPELIVSAPNDRPMLAQVTLANDVPLNVAIPIARETLASSCSLTVELVQDRLQAGVSYLDPRVDAIARYLNGGNLQEAAGIAPDAEGLLGQKLADPFGAALGAYALLRLGELERLHHWPRNLASRFGWLADGAIIAGEEAAREGEHGVAVDYLCDAVRCGLPVFADGFSILVSRVREYAGATSPPPGVTARAHAEVKAAADKLLPLTPYMHFARVSLAFHGADVEDPAGSQRPITPRAGEGWRRLDQSSSTLVAV